MVKNEVHLGKGYGISTSFLNISLTVAPFIVATIRVMSDNFIPVEMYFIAMGLCGVFAGFALKNIDEQNGGALEVPEIQVEVPVIVSRSTVSTPIASPALSKSRSGRLKQRRHSTMNSLRNGSDLASRKRWEDEGDTSFHKSDAAQQQDDNSYFPVFKPQSAHPPGSSATAAPLSPVTDPMRRYQGRSQRPLLGEVFPTVASPLQQRQYMLSPASPRYRYGTISMGERRDVEDGPSRPVMTKSYSVSMHPILYNPLRGSTGSFRISRSARSIGFGEGEEGQIILDGEVVEEPGTLETDSEQEEGNDTETEQGTVVDDGQGDGDMDRSNRTDAR